ncbi:GntR family transcriptional regulator [Microbacterium yannicii]|uniref:GntR family transcriptional regulator n=1 Tax=Microbacterium yannicii TaxID=671622 RepID=A0ABP9MH79_9MICO|nr:GntR family transcriptional regulator [Microbacterium yannicii]MCO5952951.1 GntR family transcriptional regulator [Microbacterium yannicii]
MQELAHRSIPELVYQEIRQQIVSGQLPPGTRLKEREISELLNVSRVPVREAFPFLEADGFIRSLPRRGAIVNELAVRDVEELFDVRESLEVLATRLAAKNADSAPFDRMEQVLAAAREAVASGDERALVQSNVAFHEAMAELSGNSLLIGVVRGILGRMEWLFRFTVDRDMRAQCEEHEELFRAVKAGHVELAGSLAFAHVASGRQPSLEKLRLAKELSHAPEVDGDDAAFDRADAAGSV